MEKEAKLAQENQKNLPNLALTERVYNSQWDVFTDSWRRESQLNKELAPQPQFTPPQFSSTWQLKFWSSLETPQKTSKSEESHPDIYNSRFVVMRNWTNWYEQLLLEEELFPTSIRVSLLLKQTLKNLKSDYMSFN